MSTREGKYTKVGLTEFYAEPKGSGSPAVIFESAWGSFSLEWKNIQIEIAKQTTAIIYDRAGYGESSYPSSARTGKSLAFELKKILENLNIKPPYILVGHSSGGIYSQVFLMEYPDHVAGIILIDSISADDDDFNKLRVPNYHRMLSVATRMDNIKSLLKMDEEQFKPYITQMLTKVYSNYPDSIKEKLIEYQTEQSFYKAVVEEYNARKDTYRYIKHNWDTFDCPLTIITRDSELMTKISAQVGLPESEAKLVEDLWQKHSKSLLDLSEYSKIVTAKNSNHQIHISRPDIIIDEIKAMLSELSL